METLIAVFVGAVVMLLGVSLGSLMIQGAISKVVKSGAGAADSTTQPITAYFSQQETEATDQIGEEYVRSLEERIVENKALFGKINKLTISEDSAENILDAVSELSVKGWKNTGPIDVVEVEKTNA